MDLFIKKVCQEASQGWLRSGCVSVVSHEAHVPCSSTMFIYSWAYMSELRDIFTTSLTAWSGLLWFRFVRDHHKQLQTKIITAGLVPYTSLVETSPQSQ